MERYKALTIIEVLLVVVATGIILALIIMALNPSKRVAEERNSRRKDHLDNIVEALTDYSIDHQGTLPEGIPVSEECEGSSNEICRTNGECSGKVNLSDLTLEEKYLPSIPRDPQADDENGVGYNIVQNDSGRITVCAPLSELGVELKVVK